MNTATHRTRRRPAPSTQTDLAGSAVLAPVTAADSDPPALQAFYGWASNRRDTRGKPLSAKSVAGYLLIWNAWLRFLLGQDTQWDHATPQDVSAFLRAAQPSSERHNATSDVTQRRYWTLLDAIYVHAVFTEMAPHNPARDLAQTQEVPATEHVSSVTLQPIHLASLADALAEHQFDPADQAGGSPSWTSLRDRALIALLLDIGPTTTELRTLRVSNVNDALRPVIVTLDSPRSASKRHLQLSNQAGIAMREWLRQHRSMMPSRPFVFFSRKGGALGKGQIYTIVNAFLRAALPRLGLEHTAHQGPALLRTSVISSWIARGIDEDEVVARAGLSARQCLRRLTIYQEAKP